MNKICPRYKSTLLASGKTYEKRDILCDREECQHWYLCSELDDYYLKEVEDVS